MSITGEPDGEPQKVGVALVDVLAGLFATVGILAALRHRDATGEGQRVEVDLLSVAARGARQPGVGRTRSPASSRTGWATQHPSIAPYELYRAADGELVVAVGNDRQFAALCEALGVPELAADPRFATQRRRASRNRAGAARRSSRRALADAPGGRLGERADRGPGPGRRRQRHRAVPSRSPSGSASSRSSRSRGADGRRVAPDRATRSGCRATPPSYRLAPPALDDGATGWATEAGV